MIITYKIEQLLLVRNTKNIIAIYAALIVPHVLKTKPASVHKKIIKIRNAGT